MTINEFGQRSFITWTTGLKERIKKAEKENIQMREIKVRAWDTKRKKMWSAEEMGKDQLTLMPDGRGFINVDGTSTALSQFCPHLIPMLFTGKDLDWWEGDIFFHPSGICTIKWYKGGLYMHGAGGYCPVDMAAHWAVLPKKIGNIHENPELLEQENGS